MEGYAKHYFPHYPNIANQLTDMVETEERKMAARNDKKGAEKTESQAKEQKTEEKSK